MKVEILGTGCPKCKKVIELTNQAAKELGIEIESVKVTDIKEIANRGVIITPALSIEGEIKCAGRVPTIDEIKKWLKK